MKRALLVGLTVVSFCGYAQQDPQFTQNYFNRLFPNPAVAGSNDAICGTLIYRNQWTGFEGRPETFLFTAHAPFRDPFLQQSHGVGLSVASDRLGQESSLNIKLAYAYRHVLGPGTISAGVALGMLQKTIGSDWNAVDDFQRDPSIPDNGAQDLGFDMDFGLYYKIPQKLYFGISMTHLNAAELEDGGTNVVGEEANLNYGVARHFYIMAGYEHRFNSDWVLKPNLFVKSDAVSTTLDVGSLIEFQQRFWGGLNYRLQDAVGAMAGIKYQMPGKGPGGGTLIAGYSYDFTTSQLRDHSSGSHEIMLSYCFNIGSKIRSERHRTVRFL